eukprot:3416122-Lingulodinium_polyedra.AAC.1
MDDSPDDARRIMQEMELEDVCHQAHCDPALRQSQLDPALHAGPQGGSQPRHAAWQAPWPRH